MLKLGCPLILMNFYVPTFHVTPADFCIIFQCNLYISCAMSCFNKTVSNCSNISTILDLVDESDTY